MAGMDGPVSEALLRLGRHLRPGEAGADLRTLHQVGGRDGDVFYRDRWSHDKVVRSTHGVNCTGSCSWKVYVKDGDHHLGGPADRLPGVGPDRPGVRAARLPARRRVLLVHLLAHPGALPVRPRRAGRDVPRGQGPARRSGRRLGGDRHRPGEAPPLPVGSAARAGWSGSPGTRPSEIIAAAHVHTIKTYGPDRVAGFSPIPAMSMVVARGRRPVHLADRRHHAVVLRLVRRPAGGLAAGVRRPDRRARVGRLVGRRLPDAVGLERAGHPHARTRTTWPRPGTAGQKVVVMSPDYSDAAKFADEWLAPHPGTDGALAMAMGHVDPEGVLRRPAGAVLHRLRQAVHRPAVPGHGSTSAATARHVPGKFLTAADLGRATGRRRRSRRCCSTRATGEPVVPERLARLPLRAERRGPVEPRPRRRGPAADPATARTAPRPSTVALPRFDGAERRGAARAACPCGGSAATW